MYHSLCLVAIEYIGVSYNYVIGTITENTDSVTLCINNISLICANTQGDIIDLKMFEFVTKYVNACIAIKNIAVVKLHNIITIEIMIGSSSHSSIHFNNCYFAMSSIRHNVHALSVPSQWHSSDCEKLDITFSETVFLANLPDECFLINDCSILKFESLSLCEMKITLDDVKFCGNGLSLIQTISAIPLPCNQQNVLISTEGNFTAEKNRLVTTSSLM